MRLLSFAVGDYVSFGAINGDGIVDLGRLLGEQYPTLGAVLRGGELHRAMSLGATSKATIALDEIRYLPTIRDPEKILWFLVIFFLHFIGALIYLFARRGPARSRTYG